jgi:hypothetical protein
MVTRLFLILVFLALGGFGAVTHGVVVDSDTRKPIEGAWISSGAAITRTDKNGQFQITPSSPTLDVRARGYTRERFRADCHDAIALNRFDVHGLYLSFWGVSSNEVRARVLDTVSKAHLNAVVIDVKGDLGLIALRNTIPLALKAGTNRVITIPDPAGLIAELHQRGLYVIARIVTFKDTPIANSHPDLAVKAENGRLFSDREGLHWTDPFQRAVWDYNIAIAVEAAKAGFDEVEFDYVRFPDAKGLCFFKPSTEANRTQAIAGFLALAQKTLNAYGVPVSADNFGYVSWNKDDTGIGQTLVDIGPVVDYMSPMLYPSGFRFGIPGVRNPLNDPYRIVYASLEKAKERTNFSGLAFRPWLQAFTDYAFDHRAFGKAQISAQIKAAQDAGAQGWLLWEPRNRYPTQALAEISRDLWWTSGKKNVNSPITGK